MSRQKTPAQTLFERVLRTWIMPELRERARHGAPVPLRLALLVWKDARAPTIFLNDEVFQKVTRARVVATGPITKGQPILSSHIKGLDSIGIHTEWGRHPHLFIAQGAGAKYYVVAKRLGSVTGHQDFDALAHALAREGLEVTTRDTVFRVYLDVLKNQYDALPPAGKRAQTKQYAHTLAEQAKNEATARAQRYFRLPTLIVHADDEFLPLLQEARQTYIDGHYFSSIASAATTADRICNWLVQRYGWPADQQTAFFARTFGQKLQRLRARKLLTPAQERLLDRMNNIRNKHLHPRHRCTTTVLKRDAFTTVRLLHELLEGTVSVFRDYQIEDGKLVPKPI